MELQNNDEVHRLAQSFFFFLISSFLWLRFQLCESFFKILLQFFLASFSPKYGLQISLTGSLANWIVATTTVRLPSLRNSFGRLLASQSSAEAVYCSIFAFFYSPMVFLWVFWILQIDGDLKSSLYPLTVGRWMSSMSALRLDQW